MLKTLPKNPSSHPLPSQKSVKISVAAVPVDSKEISKYYQSKQEEYWVSEEKLQNLLQSNNAKQDEYFAPSITLMKFFLL